MKKIVLVILCLLLAVFQIEVSSVQANSGTEADISAWPLAGPTSTPYGNVDENIAAFIKDLNQADRVDRLTNLSLMARWYIKEKTGRQRVKAIKAVLIEEVESGQSALLQQKAIGILGQLIEKTCEYPSFHQDIYPVLDRIALNDHDPGVRRAVVGNGPLYQFIKCNQGEIRNNALQTTLKILLQDPDSEVLDDAASTLRFCREKGVSLPDNTKEVMEKAVRQRFLVMMPDQAWASFVRGPVKFHNWSTLHDLLIDSPLPESGIIVSHALYSIDSSLKYAKDLPDVSPVRIKLILLKYILSRQSLYPQSHKSSGANLAYMEEAVRKDNEKSLKQIIEFAKNIQTNTDIREASSVGGKDIAIKKPLEDLEKDGGLDALLDHLISFVSPEKIDSPEARYAAWQSLIRIGQDEKSRFTLSMSGQLNEAATTEKDPLCLEQARILMEMIRE